MGPYLDEGERGSWLQGFVFMLHLIDHVLLHPLFLINLPLMHHVEEGARRHGDGDSMAGLGLPRCGGKQQVALTLKLKQTN